MAFLSGFYHQVNVFKETDTMSHEKFRNLLASPNHKLPWGRNRKIVQKCRQLRADSFPRRWQLLLFLAIAIFSPCRFVFVLPYFRICPFFDFTFSRSEMNVSYVRAGSLSSLSAVPVLNKRKYKLHDGRLRFMELSSVQFWKFNN